MSEEDITNSLQAKIDVGSSFSLSCVMDENNQVVSNRSQQEDLKVCATLPQPCPIQILGRTAYGSYWILNAAGHVVEYGRKDFNKQSVMQLFGGCMEYLCSHFHKWQKNPEYDSDDKSENKAPKYIPDFTKYEVDHIYEALFNTAAQTPIVDLSMRMRGLGCWKSPDGDLVVNSGAVIQIFKSGVKAKPIKSRPCIMGDKQDMVIYEGRHPMREIEEPPTQKEVAKIADNVLKDFKGWNWTEDIFPILLLGQLGVMFFGGALKWRSMVWLSGEGGDGKSYLQEYIDLSFNGWTVKSSDATEAALRQKLGNDSLPVQLDEAEGDGTNTEKLEGIKKFMRIAASGDVGMRGGSNHQATSFRIQSSMIMSSIYIPSLNAADDSRILQMFLKKHKNTGEVREKYDEQKIKGQFLPMMDYLCHNWYLFKKFEPQCFEWLITNKMSERLADVYAPIITFSYMLRSDNLTADSTLQLSTDYEGLLDILNRRDETPDWMLALSRLRQYDKVPAGGGVSETIGRVIERVNSDKDSDYEERVLRDFGLYWQETNSTFFIPHAHEGLSKIFAGSPWGSQVSQRSGGWHQAFRRAAGSVEGIEHAKKKIAKRVVYGYNIPIEYLIDGSEAVEVIE